MRVLVLALVALASFRTWRLLGRDDITAFMRSPLPPYALKGVTCPWCMGTWVTAGVAVLVHVFVFDFVAGVVLNRAAFVALAAAAVTAVVGFLGEADGRLREGA